MAKAKTTWWQKVKTMRRRFAKWLAHAVRDVQAWTANLITIVCSAGAQWLGGLDSAAFMALPMREKALKILIAIGPGILMHIATARQHQSAEDIVAKLAAKGVMFPVAAPEQKTPPAP